MGTQLTDSSLLHSVIHLLNVGFMERNKSAFDDAERFDQAIKTLLLHTFVNCIRMYTGDHILFIIDFIDCLSSKGWYFCASVLSWL